MGEAGFGILIMTAVVLLPMIPAYVLFRFLPSEGRASGPLHGLKVKFGGAFAGYLVVFLALLWVRPAHANHYHSWNVSGTIDFQRDASEPLPDPSDTRVGVVPPQLQVHSLGVQGVFNFEIPVIDDEGGRPVFPDLRFDLPGYLSATIPLDPARTYGSLDVKAEHNSKTRVITLTRIALQSSKSIQTYSTDAAQKPEIIRDP